ncbi:hypothetical protein LXL04_035983 [Taraxacum kok-saghyz]
MLYNILVGYPRDAPETVLFDEWFRFEKPNDQLQPRAFLESCHSRGLFGVPAVVVQKGQLGPVPKAAGAEQNRIHACRGIGLREHAGGGMVVWRDGESTERARVRTEEWRGNPSED